ncbi:MAG: hypothetical protein ACK4IT_05005 [Thioalkalivibrionaceae bacterium]
MMLEAFTTAWLLAAPWLVGTGIVLLLLVSTAGPATGRRAADGRRRWISADQAAHQSGLRLLSVEQTGDRPWRLVLLALGYGAPLGWGITIGLMALGATAGFGFQALPIASLLGAIGIALIAGAWRHSGRQNNAEPCGGALDESGPCSPVTVRAAPSQRSEGPPQTVGSTLLKSLLWLLLALIILRVSGLAVEVSLRPVFAWDAWYAWSIKAKHLFYADQFVIFSPLGNWLRAAPDELIYQTGAPQYPLFVSLLQTYMAAGLGLWHDAYVNLPWLTMLIAAATALYAQARLAGATPLTAVVAAYLLVSLPMVGIHTMLGGYADLWLGLVFGLFLTALILAWVQRDWRQAALAILLLPLLVSIKKTEPTALVLISLIPAVIWALRPALGRAFWPLIAVAAVVGGFLVFTDAGQAWLAQVVSPRILPSLENIAGVIAVFWVATMAHASWHLALPFILAAIAALAIPAVRRDSIIQLLAIFTIGALLLFTMAYSGDRLFGNIENFTVANRGLLYIAVPMSLWFALTLQRVIEWALTPRPSIGAHPATGPTHRVETDSNPGIVRASDIRQR